MTEQNSWRYRWTSVDVETCNLFNWASYGFPESNVSNLNSFGIISSSPGDPREVPLAVEVLFLTRQ